MKLSRDILNSISSEKVIVPKEEMFELPERVLQFGTGVLLRGLPDYFIDVANRAGIFNGRIIIVKSTSKADATPFVKQTGLYTLCQRGIQNGVKKEENIIISSISRVLIAQDNWGQVLECAFNENLKIIISNTTEAGIQLVNEDIHCDPPASYPGKLLSFLYERFISFKGNEGSGLVIIPTELILDNGIKLKSVVLELAHLNSLEDEFIEWLEKYNYFCNSLVDRIVTGMPGKEIRNSIENELGYEDDLLAVSEIYSLWAIEGGEKIKNILSFAKVNEGMVIKANIEEYRELKLRLLNGTHTLACAVSFLAKMGTVKQSLGNEIIRKFIEDLMRNEIAPSIPFVSDDTIKQTFISIVLDRFENPHIHHHWKSIALKYSSKMNSRCIPLLINYYKRNEVVPQLFALGFAAYLYFMKAVKQVEKEYFGELMGEFYLIEDEMADRYYYLWNERSVAALVEEILKDKSFWENDLSLLPGFQQAVTDNLNCIITEGMMGSLESIYLRKKIEENES